jgi:hypothetical protein
MKILNFSMAVLGIVQPVVASRLGLHPLLWVFSGRVRHRVLVVGVENEACAAC